MLRGVHTAPKQCRPTRLPSATVKVTSANMVGGRWQNGIGRCSVIYALDFFNLQRVAETMAHTLHKAAPVPQPAPPGDPNAPYPKYVPRMQFCLGAFHFMYSGKRATTLRHLVTAKFNGAKNMKT